MDVVVMVMVVCFVAVRKVNEKQEEDAQDGERVEHICESEYILRFEDTKG